MDPEAEKQTYPVGSGSAILVPSIYLRSLAGGGYDDRHGGGGRYDAPYGGGYDPPQHAYQPAPAQQPVAVNPSTGQPVSYVFPPREMKNISRGPTFGDFVAISTEALMQDVTAARL
jgi:hypothetical protein